MSAARGVDQVEVCEPGPNGYTRASPGRWLAGGLIAGGALVMAGATLPWLTLYAGLQHYSGMTGLYGQLAFGAGALAFAVGLVALRMRPPWLGRASALLGGVLFLFGAWLLAGLAEILHRHAALMLVPRPGPGLFVVVVGAMMIVLGPLAERIVGKRTTDMP